MPGALPDFDLLTSLRYDPKLLTAAYNTDVNGIELPYLFFRFHIERLAAGAAAFNWPRASAALRAPGAAQRLLHMCDQAVMESPLTGKEKGIGVSGCFFDFVALGFRNCCWNALRARRWGGEVEWSTSAPRSRERELWAIMRSAGKTTARPSAQVRGVERPQRSAVSTPQVTSNC